MNYEQRWGDIIILVLFCLFHLKPAFAFNLSFRIYPKYWERQTSANSVD